MTNSNNSEYITVSANPIFNRYFIWIAFLISCLILSLIGQANIIIILYILFLTIILIRTFLIGFKYNNKKLIVFNLWFGKIAEYQIKDIVYINSFHTIISYSMVNIMTDRKMKRYYIDILPPQKVKAMVTYIKEESDRILLKYRILSNKENKYKRDDFECRRIHIKPEKGLYIKLLLSFYLLYILAWVIWWDSILSTDWILFWSFWGIPIPILIYKKKMLRTANNIYLDNCTITITNKTIDYEYWKKIPFEAINRIKYADGILIELKTGPKIKYKICGDQARKRLGIEKIIDEFERFNNF